MCVCQNECDERLIFRNRTVRQLAYFSGCGLDCSFVICIERPHSKSSEIVLNVVCLVNATNAMRHVAEG